MMNGIKMRMLNTHTYMNLKNQYDEKLNMEYVRTK